MKREMPPAKAARGKSLFRLGASLPSVIRSSGGAGAFLRKAAGVFRRDGWRGLNGALRRMGGGPNFHAPKDPAGRTLDRHRKKYRREARRELKTFLRKEEAISLPRGENPVVSVLLVLHNQAELTFRCLASLSRERRVPFETIVIDNGSTDLTGRMMSSVQGVEYIANPDNAGFLKGVNQAANRARGEYLLLLNNDTELPPGSLAAAVDRMTKNADVGAVGGPIVLLDGTLQEAGSIVWKDGNCLGYGRGRAWSEPEFRFARPVDYCSAAFLLLRRSVFDRLGGLDDAYAPAYYEETDFCARLWEHGWPVHYEPKARIHHFEFGSMESRTRAMDLQLRHRDIFVSRHRQFLESRLDADPKNILAARFGPGRKRAVLMIDDRVPHRSLGTGYPRAAEIIKEIVAQDWAVTFYPLIASDDGWTECYKTLPDTVEIMLGYGAKRLGEFLEERKDHYDVVWVSRAHNMEAVKSRAGARLEALGTAKRVYDAEALFALREIGKREALGNPMTAEEAEDTIAREIALAHGMDAVVAVSTAEAAYFKPISSPVHVLPHVLKPGGSSRAFSERGGVLFVGALTDEDSPNVDGIVWFVESGWPVFKAAVPDASLALVGNCTSSRVKRLESADIRILGRVEELSEIYARQKVFIAPARYAAGIPHKVHEAASFGLPVVATSLLARQLGWKHGAELLAGDTPGEFAGRMIELYRSPALWQKISDGAFEAVKRDCSHEDFSNAVKCILSSSGQ